MKVTIYTTRQVDVTEVDVIIPIDSDDPDLPIDFPFRSENEWRAIISIDYGRILGWPSSYGPAEMYVKACDRGTYSLLDERGECIASVSDYVPHGLIPGEFGDYIHLVINKHGYITNWPKHKDMDFSAFLDTP